MKKWLTYLSILLISSFSLLVLYKNIADINFKIEYFILFIVFITFGLLFHFFTRTKNETNGNYIVSNFNFSLIFMTNPFISFIYSLLHYLLIYLIFDRQKKEYHQYIWLIGQNFLSTYIGYFVIIKLMKDNNSMDLSPELLVVFFIAFLISNVFDILMRCLFLYLYQESFSVFEEKDYIIKSFSQSMLISTFITPLLISTYLMYSYGGIIFPIGLVYVLSYNFKKNLDKQEELKEFKEKSYRDGLTGVYNRRYLEEYLEEINDVNETVAVIMMDIDRFKSVNDGYNHSVGDQVLKHFSLILNKCIRQYDMLARYGGEEFIIILKNLSPEQTRIVAERIRASVEASFAVVNFNGQPVNIRYTTSLGVCYCQDKRSYTLKSALKEADRYLYLSKNNGRNRITANI